MKHMKHRKKRGGFLFYAGVLGAALLFGSGLFFLCRTALANAPQVPPAPPSPAQSASYPSGVNGDAWNLLLVNSRHLLPSGYTIRTKSLSNGQLVDERIFSPLQEMLDHCRRDGLNPVVCSAYRPVEKQAQLFESKVEELQRQGRSPDQARKEASRWIAVPGASEHNTGLAVDIVARSYQLLDEKQAETPEQKWLMAHCMEYGFILRYPPEKSDITGITYEPWHYRYVGRDAAAEIMSKGLTLEEYLGKTV